ncbi:ABC transporter ATP-binding protein [Halopiger goleimassiliensis]|uniref:ABC transporter ATP-binding protein n=1 Tax=Halopiger goleimassiliensis TaxID=1293048 RepID=UPI0006775EFE|nr:ABC transporter ATP-binding protein [Halopiger goleimassiliensis]
MTHIELDDVSKYFDAGETVANYRLSLSIDDGEFLVLLGPSGCGKTTALRLIAGLENPSEGEIRFDGERVNARSPSDRNVAMVFQNYALYPHMTVGENIAYPLKIRDVPPAERDRRVAEVTELLHIKDQIDKPPAELSGGQRQRVALARAIVREPSVFLLDEPLSNLDAKLRQEMRSELKRLQDELDITTIYVTHNQEEAMSMADRVAVMNRGTIRQVAPPSELYQRPRTEWVARFVGSPPMNLFRGRRRNGSIDLGEAGRIDLEGIADGDLEEVVGGRTEAEPRRREVVGAAGTDSSVDERGGGADEGEGGVVASDAAGSSDESPSGGEGPAGENTISLGIRPEDLTVRREPPPNGNAITGTVDTVEPLGEYTLVNVTVNDQLVNAKVSEAEFERGERVALAFDDEDAYLYDEAGDLVA